MSDKSIVFSYGVAVKKVRVVRLNINLVILWAAEVTLSGSNNFIPTILGIDEDASVSPKLILISGSINYDAGIIFSLTFDEGTLKYYSSFATPKSISGVILYSSTQYAYYGQSNACGRIGFLNKPSLSESGDTLDCKSRLIYQVISNGGNYAYIGSDYGSPGTHSIFGLIVNSFNAISMTTIMSGNIGEVYTFEFITPSGNFLVLSILPASQGLYEFSSAFSLKAGPLCSTAGITLSWMSLNDDYTYLIVFGLDSNKKTIAKLANPVTFSEITVTNTLDLKLEIVNSIPSPSSTTQFIALARDSATYRMIVTAFAITASPPCLAGYVNYYNFGCFLPISSPKCHPLCTTCLVFNNPDACTEASGTAELTLFSSSCPFGQTFDEISLSCKAVITVSCDISCKFQCFAANDPNSCIPQCHSGQVFNISTNNCENCVNDCSLCIDMLTCELCSAGLYRFRPISGSDSCQPSCPPNSYMEGSYKCKECLLNCATCTDDTHCSNCFLPFFLYQPSSAPHVCLPHCPQEFYDNINNNICTPCTSNCLNCTTGTDCTLCKAGNFLDTISGSVQNCISVCRDGYYGNTGTGKCEMCSQGKYNFVGSGSITQCLSCSPGYYANNFGQAACTPCPKGTASLTIESITQNDCLQCSKGKYNDNTGQSLCTNCPKGTHNNAEGIDSLNGCLSCLPGTYGDQPGLIDCTQCSLGKANSHTGSTDESDCFKCDNSYYNDILGQSACTPCPLGMYHSLTGATSITICQPCPKGTYSDIQGLAVCKACGKGKMNDQTGATAESFCVLCVVGYYNDQIGQEKCTPCIPGKANPNPGSQQEADCSNCPKGTYNDKPGQPTCFKCDIGKSNLNTGSNSPSACVDCQAGFYNNLLGQESCFPCPAGKLNTNTGSNDISFCIDCPKGQYNVNTGQTKCTLCDIGKANIKTGSSVESDCLPCSAGYYNSLTGQEFCSPCSEGKFNLNTGSKQESDCTFCSKGTYADSKGQASCTPCKYGTYSITSGSKTESDCIDCPPGTYNDALGRADSCIPCPDGTFNPYSGQKNCIACISDCKKCLDTQTCFQCNTGLYIKHLTLTTDSCVADCGLRLFGNKVTWTCTPCDFRCLSCDSEKNTDCTFCDTDIEGVARLAPKTCRCANGFGPNIVSKKCEKCSDPLCETCSETNLEDCLECKIGISHLSYDPILKKCQCEDGYTQAGLACKPCHYLCKTCTGLSNFDCLPMQCQNSGFPLESDPRKCLFMCDYKGERLFLDKKDSICRYCRSPCDLCFGTDEYSCVSCLPGFFQDGTHCLGTCPRKTFNNEGVCVPCDKKCMHCINKVNYCVEGCEAPYLKLDHQCLVSCPKSYAQNNGECLPCNDEEETCYFEKSLDRTYALECKSGWFLNKGSCLTICPSGLYPETSTKTCEPCHKACLKCFGSSQKACIDCNKAQGFVMASENFCDYPTCINGMYFDKSFLACVNCPLGCATCTSVTYCMSCSKGYEITKANICIDSCDKEGFQKKDGSFECEEICGDGKNMRLNACDDGNTKNGDGCSSTCQVEEFFECSGGNEFKPDTCRKTLKPTVEMFKYYGNKSAMIRFSERIKVNTKTLEECIGFKVTGTKIDDDIGLTWTHSEVNTQDFKTLYIDLNFNSSLSGSEYLSFTLLKKNCIIDIYGNLMIESSKDTKLKKYIYISNAQKAAADASGKASVYSVLPSMAFSLGLSLVFNTPLEGMWAIINVIQMLSYITLMRLDFPENVLIFFSQIESVHNYNKWMPNMFEMLLGVSNIYDIAYNDQFAKRGFNSSVMLFLAGADIIMMVVMIIAIGIFSVLANCWSLFNKILRKLKFSSILRSFVQSFLKLCLAAFVNITVYSFSNPASVVASIAAMIVACGVICIPAFLSEFLYQNHELIINNEEFQEKFSSLVDGLRKKSLMSIMYYPIFLFRRVSFAVILVVLSGYPSIQLGLQMCCSIAVLYYVISFHPFTDKHTWYSAINAEILMAVSLVLLTVFLKESPYSNIVGWAIIGITIGSLLLSWIFMFRQHYVMWKKAKEKINMKKEKMDASRRLEIEPNYNTQEYKHKEIKGKASPTSIMTIENNNASIISELQKSDAEKKIISPNVLTLGQAQIVKTEIDSQPQKKPEKKDSQTKTLTAMRSERRKLMINQEILLKKIQEAKIKQLLKVSGGSGNTRSEDG